MIRINLAEKKATRNLQEGKNKQWIASKNLPAGWNMKNTYSNRLETLKQTFPFYRVQLQ